MMKKRFSGLLFFLLFAGSANAGVVFGGSDLLSAADHAQLETWLGIGQFDLTNIFDKSSGDTASDFHAAADGQGATFSLIEIINGSETMVIGGYNQDSWNSSSSYNLIDHTVSESFLFNLDTGEKYERNRWNYDTYNRNNYGPTFGGGHDLFINSTLSGGSANIGHSYGDASQYATTSYRNNFTGTYNSWVVGQLEVFTLTQPSVGVPGPAGLALFLMGLAGLCFTRRK